jgi:MFS family permease
MKIIYFIKEHKNLLLFGALLTFFSSFGQTFLIALYVPSLAEKFNFSNGAFGTIYGSVTLVSALTLTFAGKFIDKYSLRNYTIVSILFMVISLTVTAFSTNAVMLVIGLWGMRLAGQGLMPHIAVTTMARHFDETRGKAIGISTLGHPVGEALLPILIAFSIYQWGWQETLLTCGASLLLILIPFVKRSVSFDKSRQITKDDTFAGVQWTQWEVLKSKEFSLTAPSMFLMPMITTGLVFYQLTLADYQGWRPEWLAACFVGYAIANSSFMLLSGALIDRVKARTLFPYYLLPLSFGIGLLLISDQAWVAVVYMFLMGVSVGFGSTIRSAVQAEMFGVASLGTVRSLFSTLIVLSTAVGPALFGFLLDNGYSFKTVLLLSLILLAAVTIQSFSVLPAFRRKRIYLRFRINNRLAIPK